MTDTATAPAVPAMAEERTNSPFAALAYRPFLWWFLSQITSASGVMTQGVATSWLVLEMTGRGVDLGVLVAATMLPSLLLGAWCGALVDRLDRRRVLIATQTLLALVSFVLFALIETHNIAYWSILALSAGSGLVSALDNPARQVYVVDIVGRRRLASAISLYEVIMNASRVLGPALGGLMLAVSGPGACILVNALSFLAPLAVLLLLHPRHRATFDDPVAPTVPASRRGATLAGVRYAWSIPAIRSCLLIAAAAGILFNPTVILPLFADRIFHLGGGGYGALLAIFGVGALPGALLAARQGEPTGRRVALFAGATGIVTALTAQAPDPILFYVGLAVLGFTSISMIAMANTFVQLQTAPEMRGRVMGAWTMALPGANPITSLAFGALADAGGARLSFTGAALMMLVVVGISFRALSRHRPGTPATLMGALPSPG